MSTNLRSSIPNRTPVQLATAAVAILAAGHAHGQATPELASLTLQKSLIAGCLPVKSTIALTAPAPAGGLKVTLSETLAAATVATTVTVPEGATSKVFYVKTQRVYAEETGTVSATLAGTTLTQGLTLHPIGMFWVRLTPYATHGGTPVEMTAKLDCKIVGEPVLIEFTSSDPSVAGTTVSSILATEGMWYVPVSVYTNPVSTTKRVVLTATANGYSKSRTQTVWPPK